MQHSAVKQVGMTTRRGHNVRNVVVTPWSDHVQYVEGYVTRGGEETYTWSACHLTVAILLNRQQGMQLFSVMTHTLNGTKVVCYCILDEKVVNCVASPL